MTDTPQAMTRDQLLLSWMNAEKEAKAAVALERQLRQRIITELFPDATEGMNNLDLGNGYTLKADNTLNYYLSNSEKSGKRTEAAIAELCRLDPQNGPLLSQRLVRWSPELSVSEWRKLPEHLQAAFTTFGKTPALSIKPGLPKVTIDAPKET